MSPVTKRRARTKVRAISELPVPEPKRRTARKDAVRTIARLLEEQMDEMGLDEEEKNLTVDSLVEHVKKVKSVRAVSRPK